MAFIQRKGWLTIDDKTDYLAALWKNYEAKREKEHNFWQDRLKPLFFIGLRSFYRARFCILSPGVHLDTSAKNRTVFERDPRSGDASLDPGGVSKNDLLLSSKVAFDPPLDHDRSAVNIGLDLTIRSDGDVDILLPISGR